jgi:hypothetical protein
MSALGGTAVKGTGLVDLAALLASVRLDAAEAHRRRLDRLCREEQGGARRQAERDAEGRAYLDHLAALEDVRRLLLGRDIEGARTALRRLGAEV